MSKLKIGMLSKPEHAKAHTRDLESMGHEVIQLGGDAITADKLPASLDLLICRIPSVAHGASDAALALSRRGLPVIFEHSVSNIRTAVAQFVATRAATGVGTKPKPKPSAEAEPTDSPIPEEARVILNGLTGRLRAKFEAFVRLMQAGAPYGARLGSYPVPTIIDRMSAAGWPTTQRAELALRWDNFLKLCGRDGQREVYEVAQRWTTLRKTTYWWQNPRNTMIGEYVVVCLPNVSQERVDKLMLQLGLFKDKPFTTSKYNFKTAANTRSAEARKAVEAARESKPAPTPSLPSEPVAVGKILPYEDNPNGYRAIAGKYLNAYYHKAARRWYIRTTPAHPDVKAGKINASNTVARYAWDAISHEVLAQEVNRLNVAIAHGLEVTPVVLPQQAPRRTTRDSVAGEVYVGYFEPRNGCYYIRPKGNRGKALAVAQTREEAAVLVEKYDRQVKGATNTPPAQVKPPPDVPPVPVAKPAPVVAPATPITPGPAERKLVVISDLDAAVEMVIEQLRLAGRSEYETPHVQIRLRDLHLEGPHGGAACGNTTGGKTTMLSLVTCSKCKASPLFEILAWGLKNAKA